MIAAGNLIVTIVDNDPNAVADNIAKNSLSVYPNPAAGFVMIPMEGVAGAAQVLLFNSVGQLVTSVSSEGNAAVRLGMNSLPAGMYTVQVVTEKEIKTGTVVKQ